MRRPLRVRNLLLGALGVLVLWMGSGGDVAAHGYGRPDRGELWTNAFRLEPGTTYTYSLRDGSHRGRGDREDGRGELNLWQTPGSEDEIRFWYSVDGVRGNGTAPAEPHALAGAVLLSALTGPEPLSQDALRLLVTPLYWVEWSDRFMESEFRRGVVWQVFQHPPLRFTARQTGRGSNFSGELTYGREVLLELTLDLSHPLPTEVTSHYGRNRYVAELVDTQGRRVLR